MPCGYTAAATEALAKAIKARPLPVCGSSSHHLPTSEQESLIEIATNGGLKMEFNQKPLPDFWIALCTEYPALANRAMKTFMPFATTYLCETGFSALASLKTKYRHRLCVKWHETETLPLNLKLWSYVREVKHTLHINIVSCQLYFAWADALIWNIKGQSVTRNH